MRDIKIGVALSGGTAKSVTHVGVLKALTEAGIPIDYVAATSGGSIVAAMYASGMPISTMESVAIAMSWRKLVSIKLTLLGFISSQRIEEFIEELIGDIDFSDLNVPTEVVATDLVTGAKRVFREGKVSRAVRASCSIPQIYLPVEIDGGYYVDGGLAEYLPIETCAAMGADFVIGSHLGPVDDIYRRPHHILQLVIQIVGLMARKNFVVSEKKADFVIHPNLDGYSSFDFEHASDMIAKGYAEAAGSIDELRRQIKRRFSMAGRVIHAVKPRR